MLDWTLKFHIQVWYHLQDISGALFPTFIIALEISEAVALVILCALNPHFLSIQNFWGIGRGAGLSRRCDSELTGVLVFFISLAGVVKNYKDM